jgi:hypothetical protein
MEKSLKNRWTDQQIAQLQRFYGELTIEELSTMVKHTPSAIRSKVYYLRKRGYSFDTTRR